jgi:hypothetical protein
MKLRKFITKKYILSIFAAAVNIASSEAQVMVFQETFDDLPNNTALTTSNTDLTFVRIGTGGGTINATSPGFFGTGASASITQATSSGSLNGIGVQSTLLSSNIYTMAFNFRPLDLAGDFVIGVGAGTSFTGTSAFNTAHGLFWLQSDSGNLERRAGSTWSDIGGGTTLTVNSNNLLHIIANGSAASASYTGGSVGAGKMDIYLNGSLLDDDVAVTTTGLNATGFRMYNVSKGDTAVDNITLWTGAVAPVAAVPEPSSGALLVFGGAALVAVRSLRKKNS